MTTKIATAASAICATYANKPDALIEILHDVQEKLGHVPEAALPVIAEALNLSRAEVYGVATFYHDFHLKPKGRHTIKVCRAEACQSMGSAKLIAALEKKLKVKLGETTKNGKITLEAAYCLGLCAAAPSMMIDDKLYARNTPAKAVALVEEIA